MLSKNFNHKRLIPKLKTNYFKIPVPYLPYGTAAYDESPQNIHTTQPH